MSNPGSARWPMSFGRWHRVPAMILLALLLLAPSSARASDCQFVLGFKALHDRIPEVVGACIDNEWRSGTAVDATFQVTTKGLLAYATASGVTEFIGRDIRWHVDQYGSFVVAKYERLPWDRPRSSIDTTVVGDLTLTPDGWWWSDAAIQLDAASNAAAPSALCRDGSISYSGTRSGTCSSHGGVVLFYG